MLYKFKSKVAGDVIMLQPNGRQILQLIGKGDAEQLIKGILLPEEIPAAIAALQKAIAEAQVRHQAQANYEASAGVELNPITLRQRAAPFIEMLQRCYQADKEVVWGV
ncbi:MAG: hypothetical protein RIR79_165 [Pseudomonadota bacterium]|jgi:excinuclease UvrABC helicase subunit UvrB